MSFSFTNRSSRESLDFLKSYKPLNREVSHLRILLYGPVGAGKSSFVNSADAALRGRVTGRADTDSTMSESSCTKEYKTYKIKKDDQSFYSFVFNDIMGIEKNLNYGVSVDDLKLALQGHMKDNYKFNPVSPLTRNDPGYNSNPSLDDKVHILVGVIPANQASLLTDDMGVH
ncbi:interferon-induced protein 44-like [Cheilinus undulatus]|uniref:interferon-induced protein 44-like n=1 Tax=Cheilinus undulatus TaxID=241271 RepID=UPI001BD433CC|nr:interferon-induced protein 44-like [Cheilinus undulatus]